MPAIIYANGTQKWFQNNKLHRNKVKDLTLPAVIHSNSHAVIDISMTNGGSMIKKSKNAKIINH